jgi:hypothetical protein
MDWSSSAGFKVRLPDAARGRAARLHFQKTFEEESIRTDKH